MRFVLRGICLSRVALFACASIRRGFAFDIKRQQQQQQQQNLMMASQADAAATVPKPLPSFYQRKLPDSCISFASKEGKKIFASALANNGLKSFFPLIQQFTTQTEPAYCGLSTLVLVLNALAVDPRQNWKGPWRWYEESMLNCCVDLEQVKKTGITLRDFQCLAFCQGLSVDMAICDDTTTLEDFRAAVQKACIEPIDLDGDRNTITIPSTTEDESNEGPLEVLVVSYSRTIMGQTGSGHFSPIAAYDKESDSVLILDTARFKYGAHWAKLPLVYEAMKPIDPDTNRPRGFFLLSFTPHDSAQANETISTDEKEKRTTIQPLSRLFRSRMSQRGERERYKKFLSSLPNGDLSWDQVLSYWSNEGSEPELVWRVVEPLRTPADSEEHAIVQNLLSLLREMLIREGGDPSCCASNSGQVPCVSSETAVYAVYLASLQEATRRNKIMGFKCSASELTKEHLLCEADLLASAIDTSDQLSF